MTNSQVAGSSLSEQLVKLQTGHSLSSCKITEATVSIIHSERLTIDQFFENTVEIYENPIESERIEAIRTLIKQHAYLDINAAPDEGPYKGITILFVAANWQQWDLVQEMLKNHPALDINAALAEGYHKGETVLWYAAYWQQWDLVQEMLKKHPAPDINAEPTEGPHKGQTIL